MKILYVILSCDKYKDTRQKWQRETWLKDASNAGFMYLDEMQEGIEDVYKNAPFKYIRFLNAFPYTESFDWFFFCDDDTFVYTPKLELLLQSWGGVGKFMIGFKGGTFPIYNLQISWCSGGAGIAINQAVIKNIQTHLRNTPRPLVTDETDISLAIWATMSTPDLIVIDNKKFSPFNPQDAAKEGLKDCITYHYCKENDFHELHNKRQTV